MHYTKLSNRPLCQKRCVRKIECNKCSKIYTGQTVKAIIYVYLEHMTAFLKPTIYKSSPVSHAVNTKHLFPDTVNVKFIKSITKGEKWLTWPTKR